MTLFDRAMRTLGWSYLLLVIVPFEFLVLTPLAFVASVAGDIWDEFELSVLRVDRADDQPADG